MIPPHGRSMRWKSTGRSPALGTSSLVRPVTFPWRRSPRNLIKPSTSFWHPTCDFRVRLLNVREKINYHEGHEEPEINILNLVLFVSVVVKTIFFTLDAALHAVVMRVNSAPPSGKSIR